MNTPKKDASSGKIKTKPPPPKKTFRIPALKAARLFLRARRKRELRPISFLQSARFFFFPEIGLLRILKMAFIIGAVIFFSLTEARESDIVFTILETFIIFAFLIIYMLTLNHLLLILDWPLFETANCIVTAVFLLVVFALALLQEENKTLFVLGGILSFAAAVVCFVDAYLITQSTKNKVKKVLGFKDEPEKVSISPVPPASKEAIPKPGTSLASSKASSVASSRPSSLATSKASSRASSKSVSRGTSVVSVKE